MEVPLANGGWRRWRPVYQSQVITRLGEGVAATGRLGEPAMVRTLAAVTDLCRTAEAHGAGEILIVATSAVREAANRERFVERVREATGRAVRVVPGGDEARLALRGAVEALPGLSGPFLLFDIGGGSTECILARDRRLAAAVSLRLGVVPLAERYMTADPVDWARYREMEREIRACLGAGLGAGFAGDTRPEQLIGTAGTVTTLAALDQDLPRYDSARVHGHVLRRDRIQRLLTRLGEMPLVARAALPCLEPGRADLIIPGTAICLAVMDRFGAASVTVSDFGLREGILIEHLVGLSTP